MRAMEVGLKGSSSPLISTYYFFLKIWDVDADMKKLYKTYNHNQPYKILRATRLGLEEWEHRNHHDHLGARRCAMLHAVGAAAGHQPSERTWFRGFWTWSTPQFHGYEGYDLVFGARAMPFLFSDTQPLPLTGSLFLKVISHFWK